MFALLLALTSWILCLPAFAGGAPAATPELDSGTLAALTAGISAAYIGYRVYLRKKTLR